MIEITLAPVIPNAIYRVSEDGGITWEDIEIDEKGSVQREFEPDKCYYFSIMPKKRKRIKKANK